VVQKNFSVPCKAGTKKFFPLIKKQEQTKKTILFSIAIIGRKKYFDKIQKNY